MLWFFNELLKRRNISIIYDLTSLLKLIIPWWQNEEASNIFKFLLPPL